MAIAPYLAVTAAEMENISVLPEKIAWLSCHFSPSGPGLSNLPEELPPGALLVIDDAWPIQDHDPALAAAQAAKAVETLECAAVLLDFQRPEGGQEMAEALVRELSCPVIVSAPYAQNLDCPVLLPPVKVGEPIKLWPDRECWLELALDGTRITLTEQGAEESPLEPGEWPEEGFREGDLHCHYALELEEHQATWTLWRTREDVKDLLEEAQKLGITQAVGLYQELGGE